MWAIFYCRIHRACPVSNSKVSCLRLHICIYTVYTVVHQFRCFNLLWSICSNHSDTNNHISTYQVHQLLTTLLHAALWNCVTGYTHLLFHIPLHFICKHQIASSTEWNTEQIYFTFHSLSHLPTRLRESWVVDCRVRISLQCTIIEQCHVWITKKRAHCISEQQ